jgi:hypothetical protein
MVAPHVAPSLSLDAFNCPFCHAYAKQNRERIVALAHNTAYFASRCDRCNHVALWDGNGTLIYPVSFAPIEGHPELPEDCQADFQEAREIFSKSPRGAAALLRLVIQKLMIDLGQTGENINNDIAALVRNGLPARIQQALDVCRVVGNNAVHPGEIDLQATPSTAMALFDLINFIVEDQISKPKQVQALFDSLPDGALKAIEKRDTPKT